MYIFILTGYLSQCETTEMSDSEVYEELLNKDSTLRWRLCTKGDAAVIIARLTLNARKTQKIERTYQNDGNIPAMELLISQVDAEEKLDEFVTALASREVSLPKLAAEIEEKRKFRLNPGVKANSSVSETVEPKVTKEEMYKELLNNLSELRNKLLDHGDAKMICDRMDFKVDRRERLNVTMKNYGPREMMKLLLKMVMQTRKLDEFLHALDSAGQSYLANAIRHRLN